MSHSTTATSTYPLAKYSKSYPNNLQPNSGSIPEWQHFTNPSIRLVLDIKKGAQLESVRLRILWSMDSDGDSAQREVVFEDIDLLTFSCLPQRPAQKQQVQGLPLKAVYRDTAVGIRYLHPVEYKDIPVYRRFQITFLSAVSVLEFIRSISTVCPCKANPSSDPAPRTMNPPAIHNQASLSFAPSMAPSQPTISASRAPTNQIQCYQSSVAAAASTSNISSTACLSREPTETQIPTVSLAPLPLAQTNSAPSSSLSNQLPETSTAPDGNPLQQHAYLPSSLPPVSSAPSATNATNAPPELSRSTSENVDNVDTHSALIASLRESTQLYDLPRIKLEQLVGDVVREEGFAKLMEDLNKMWAVKTFVGV